MARTVHLAAELAAPPAKIFDAYLDPRTHAAITGAPAVVSPKAGAKFSAFGGTLSGTILELVPKSLIVQSWRASHWKNKDSNSILVLSLHPWGRGKTLIDLVHANVPDHDFAGVSQGGSYITGHPGATISKEAAAPDSVGLWLNRAGQPISANTDMRSPRWR